MACITPCPVQYYVSANTSVEPAEKYRADKLRPAFSCEDLLYLWHGEI